jgi:hypothetical protein
MTGVVERVPFLITLTAPHFSATNILPSGAKARAVGIESPVTTVSTSNPATAQTLVICIPKNIIKQHTKEGIFSKKRWRIVYLYMMN